jgi:hypothetical protein
MLVIPGPFQGVAGERPGLLGEVVEGSLQVVESLSIFAFRPPLEVLLFPVDVPHRGDEQSGFATADILAGDSTTPPHGSVEIGSAVAVDQCHVYYAPSLAPNPASIRRRLLFSFYSLFEQEVVVGEWGSAVVGRWNRRAGDSPQDAVGEVNRRFHVPLFGTGDEPIDDLGQGIDDALLDRRQGVAVEQGLRFGVHVVSPQGIKDENLDLN